MGIGKNEENESARKESGNQSDIRDATYETMLNASSNQSTNTENEKSESGIGSTRSEKKSRVSISVEMANGSYENVSNSDSERNNMETNESRSTTKLDGETSEYKLQSTGSESRASLESTDKSLYQT
ncbi:hypothetical protein MHBO_000379 [Bonamia ostreae]|uniref:Uncharacterized protein n=1 Tax=Bonamia ostreae TaxID=126728 RepID=A0ABV2AFE1_9EUKA